MAIPLDQFTKRLVDSGLITADDVAAIVSALPAERQADSEALARDLVRRRRLTAFQVQEIYQGRGRALTLGNYTVLDKLGQGGMGMVLKAEHRRMERQVALKVLSPKFTQSPEAVARFQREVKAAAKLNHQNIVTAYDADEAAGTHFLVMEYVEGTDLSAMVKKDGPLPFERALPCIIQAARGLEYAHGRGVVHRDIKPANLLLDRGGMVKILDMGLARLDGGDAPGGADQDELTGTGQIMGTIDYMAPEQALSTKSADRRADIYSLGITLWYLLTGRPAYTGDTAMAKLLAHRERPIPSIRDACPGVPPALDAVFARMVAKTPEARYQTMTECVADLESCRAGQQVTAPSVASAAGEDSRLSEFLRGLEQSSAGRGVTGKPLPKAAGAPAAAAPKLTTPEVIEETLANTLPAGDTDPTTQHSLSVDPAALGSAPLTGSLLSKLPFAPTRRNLAIASGAAAALLIALAVGLWYANRGTVRVADDDSILASPPQADQPPGVSEAVGPSPQTPSPPQADQRPGDDNSQASGGRKPPGNAAASAYQWPAGTPAPAIAPFDTAQAKKHQEEWAAHLGVPVEYTNSIGMEFRLVPPGEFLMGSVLPEGVKAALASVEGNETWKEVIRSEAPKHNVVLTHPYYLGVYEVTQSQYQQVVGKNPSDFASTRPRHADVTGQDTASLPVEMVFWNDAAEFCRKLSALVGPSPASNRTSPDAADLVEVSYRLPTEAEWEFACRAGTITRYWCGDNEELVAGWIGPNSRDRPHPVGELAANPFGLFDVHGNVQEWVQDVWDPAYYGQFVGKKAIDPRGPYVAGGMHVTRGGYWSAAAHHSRSASRLAFDATGRTDNIGFRVALSVDAVRNSISARPSPAPAVAPFDAAQAKKHQEEWAAHLGVPVEYTNSIGMKFQLVPPGEFLMGVRDADVTKLSEAADAAVAVLGEGSKEFFDPLLEACRPQRRVRLTRPLYVAEAETTIGQFRRFIDATGHKTAAETNGKGGQVFVDGQWTQSTDYHWRKPGTWTSTDDHPVAQVGRGDAIAFCDWLAQEEKRACRLPTEAEWEFAARAGGVGMYSFGDDPLQLPNYGWHTADLALLTGEKGFFGRLFPVKQKRPNAFGLYDMQGNVDEFCGNWFTTNYSELPDPAIDPAGPETGEFAVTRGGSAFAVPAWCGVGVRWSHSPEHPQYATGFRVVCEVKPRDGVAPDNGTTDVLKLVDVDQDNLQPNGRWEWQDASRKVLRSTGGMSNLQIPLTPDGEYRIRLRVQKLGVQANEGLVLGLRIGGKDASLVLGYDSDGKVIHGLEPLLHFTEGTAFPVGREFDVAVTVRGRKLLAAVDGQTVFQNDSVPQYLVGALQEVWKRRDAGHLCLGCAGDHWRIIAFDYEPLQELATAGAQAGPPANTAPPAGAALEFDGKSGHVHVPTLSRDDVGPVTLEAWVRPEFQEGHKAVALLSGQHPLQINTYNDRLYAMESRTALPDIDETTLPRFTPGQWHHVAAVCDEANVRLFVDGRGQTPIPLQPAAVQKPHAFTGLWLGGHPHDQRPKRIEYRYRGQIDEIRVSRGARYQNDFQPPRRIEADADTLALYHCDKGAGDVLADASGHGHEGRIVGAKWATGGVTDPQQIDPQRAVVEWVLSKGGNVAGSVRTSSTEEFKRLVAGDPVPSEFDLREVDLRRSDISVTDLDRLLPAVNLRILTLIDCPLDAAALPRLARMPYLTSLNLVDAPIKSSNFATLANLPCLAHLRIATAQIDDGCEAIARLPRLRTLTLWRQADLTAADVRALAGMPGLRQLSLDGFTTFDNQIVSDLQRSNPLLRVSFSGAEGPARPLETDPALAVARGLMDEGVTVWGSPVRSGKPLVRLVAADLDAQHTWLFGRADFPKGHAFTAQRARELSALAGDLAAMNADSVTNADALAAALADSGAVENLAIVNSDLSDNGLEHLGSLVGLRYLNIQGCPVTPAAIERFHVLVPNCRLVFNGGQRLPRWLPPPHFSLSPGEFDRAVAEWVHSVGGLVGLVSTGRPYQEVPAGQALPDGPLVLTKADLLGRPVMDDDLRRFDRLPHLSVLILTNTTVTDGGLEALGELPNLNKVYLGGLSLTPRGLRALRRYPLVKLHVDHVDRAQLEVIAEMVNLQELRASRGPIGDQEVPLLAKLANLTLVNLQGTQVTQAGVDALRKLLPNCRVKTSFGEFGPPPMETTGNSDVTPDRAVAEWVHSIGGGLGVVPAGGKFQVVGPDQPLPEGPLALTIVDLLDRRLTDQDLSRLDRLPYMQTLILRNTGITDAGLEALGDMPQLKQIYLGGLKLTPRGLKALLRYTELITLGMNGVDRAQLEIIAQMANLAELSISASPIGDADLPVLAKLEHLKSLNLEYTQVTQAGVDALLQALPNCRVKTSFGEFGPPAESGSN